MNARSTTPSRSAAPSRAASELDSIDEGWEDPTALAPDAVDEAVHERDTLEVLDQSAQSPFDRVTVVPEVPTERYAKELMGPPSSPPAVESTPPSSAGRSALLPPEAASGPSRALSFEGPATALELADHSRASDGAPPSKTQARKSETPPVTERSRERALSVLKDRYALGDYTGALVIAKGILEQEPDDTEAQLYVKRCQDVLIQMYTSRLGSRSHVVRVVAPAGEIRWLSLDHRAGFVLSLADGQSTVEEIIDASGMPLVDALRVLCSLLEQRVIILSPRP